jgi:23S rRNA (cytosine1962-C5)-methyltransferase
MKTIVLKAGKERSLLRRHPWIFDNAIAKGGADAGETVRVQSQEGQFLAWAAYSPNSKIRARAWSFTESDRIDAPWMAARVAAAVQARAAMRIASDSMRLVHGEADDLPGLIVDRYADTLVVQFLSAGVERHKQSLLDALTVSTGLSKVYERSDAQVRTLEGLPLVKGWLRGPGVNAHSADKLEVAQPSTALQMKEHGWTLHLDIDEGHKTGYYLDQRESRARFAAYAQKRQFQRVLNCFSYTGGFTVAALTGGAEHVTSIDSSASALALARRNVAANGFDADNPDRCRFLDADVNQSLRAFIESGESFDAIVLDPAKLAPTAAHADRAARAYKDLNRLALKLLRPGGVLFTYSCSGGISADLFHKIVASAGHDAHVDAHIAERLGADCDHPMSVNFPEGEYLKGLILVKK